MKRWLFAVLAASMIVSGSVLAQETKSADPLCSADALIATFAEAVAGDSLQDWLIDVKAASCAESLSAAINLVSLYSSFDDASAASDLVAQWATSAEATSQYTENGWSAEQATGEPNVLHCGDSSDAWASARSNEEAALSLWYDEPVNAFAIRIYQSYTPGSITQVAVIDAETGDIVAIPNSADVPETEPCPRVFSVVVSGDDLPAAVNGVVISVDQSIGGNWNEIDAVELIGLPLDD